MNKQIFENIVIRFSGDSGDGVQLLGNQFSNSSVITSKNDIYTFVDFPSEIRAPAGSLSGISSFQLAISSKKLYTVNDEIDLLIAFNPAALKANIKNLKINGIIIIDIDSFNDKNLKRAGFKETPINTNYFDKYTLIKISITKLTYECVKEIITSVAKAKRCKNFFMLGVICWIFDRNITDIIKSLEKKFNNDTSLYEANKKALKTGYNYSDTTEILNSKIFIPPYIKNDNDILLTKISGNKAFCFGAISSAYLFDLPLFSANYPITPASEILHELSLYINNDFKILQLEDEIASINAVIGASYGGALAFTCTSGPGLDLMQESIGLAIMARLPLVLINIQRSGPSTGIPTKSEQTDLLASIFGRHGESAIIVLAPKSPSDCFWTIIESFYLAIAYLGPVLILSDTNLSNSFELWEKPKIQDIEKKFNINFKDLKKKNINFNDNASNLNIFENWIVPGKKNFQTCIGGLERDKISNDVSHDPINHNKMTKFRNDNLNSIIKLYLNLNIEGNDKGENIIITWGSVYGTVKTIYDEIKYHIPLSILCLRYLYPLPLQLTDIINNFKNIIVIEENLGQLALILKSKYIKKIISINQVSGQPFNINYLKTEIINIIKINNERK